MALLNAKRFLTQLEEEAAYRRVISTLLEGVAAHALNLDSDAHLNFCERIGATRRALVAETTVEALLVNAGEAVQAIGDYTREMNCLLRAQDAEMQNMSAMLTERVAERVSPQPETTDDSSERATPMEDASSGEARVRVYKLTTREGAQRPTPEEDQSQGALHKPVSREKITRRDLSLDPITGLPGHTLAQAQFLSALRTGEPRLVGVFVLDSAQRITLRFGPAMGEEVMRSLKQHLAGLLEASDRMFRWPGRHLGRQRKGCGVIRPYRYFGPLRGLVPSFGRARGHRGRDAHPSPTAIPAQKPRQEPYSKTQKPYRKPYGKSLTR